MTWRSDAAPAVGAAALLLMSGLAPAPAGGGAVQDRYLAPYRASSPPRQAPVPVMKGRDQTYDALIPFSVEKPFVYLRSRPRLYAYSVRNLSDSEIQAPVLYDKYLWISVPALFRTGGFDAIEGELDRAKALHSFVSEYHSSGGLAMEAGAFRDPLKYLVHYGEGICHAAATAQAVLMELAGLKSRIWWLSGHVVPETYADGAWRMMDPDHKVYFHPPGAPEHVYGVEQLSSGRGLFGHYSAAPGGPAGPYPAQVREIYLSSDDNSHIPAVKAGEDTSFAYYLRPGERVVFTNFNWGRHFEPSAYPGSPARYYNGYFESPVSAGVLRLSPGVRVSGQGRSLTLISPPGGAGLAEAGFRSPFPIVGGAISLFVDRSEGGVSLALVSPSGAEAREFSADTGRNSFEWTGPLGGPGPFPDFYYSLRIKMKAGSRLDVSGLSVISDFQYGRLPLLGLHGGENVFNTHLPPGVSAGMVEGEIAAKYW